MRILVTGSNGMLGTELCEVFKETNEITGVDIKSAQSTSFRTHFFYKESIINFKGISKIIEKRKPEVIIHTAAWTDVDGCEDNPEKAYEVNTDATKNIAEIANKAGIPLVFISTDFVFDGKKSIPYTENDTCRPLCVYGKTKRESEKVIEEILERYVIIRTSWLYGENGRDFVDVIINKAGNEGHLKVVNDQIGSPTCVKDLACALKTLVERLNDLEREIFHISNSGQCSWYDFAVRILAEKKCREETVIVPVTSSELSRSASRPGFSVLDSKKFENLTGHKMRVWHRALAEYIRMRKE